MIPLLIAISLAAAPKVIKPHAVADAGTSILAVDQGASLEQAGQVKEIELDDKRARAVYRIRTAISIPAVVEFPDNFVAPPTCGDCADATKPGQSSALFALQAEGNLLIVKPRLYPGIQSDGSTIAVADFLTTITVRLQSLTVTLQVELTEDKKQANPRVRFVLPNRGAESKFVTDEIAKAKSKIEADFATRVEVAAADQLLRSFLEPHECRFNTSRKREADMVLELKELCRFGRRVYVRFSLENRSRSLFVIGDAVGSFGDGKTLTAGETHSLLSVQEVAFQAASEGVVSFDVDESARTFELKISERGGRNRSLTLSGFSF